MPSPPRGNDRGGQHEPRPAARSRRRATTSPTSRSSTTCDRSASRPSSRRATTGRRRTLSAPACVSSAISVGSTDKSDVVSWFSNVASFMSLFAPGRVDPVVGSRRRLRSVLAARRWRRRTWRARGPCCARPSPGAERQRRPQRAAADRAPDHRHAVPRNGVTVPRVRIFRALATFVPVTHPAPVLTSVSPSHAARRRRPATLTLIGTGFDGFSVLYWNGAPRPTTVISTTQVRGDDFRRRRGGAGNRAGVGCQSVAGRRNSASLTVLIDPPPSLTVSATTVAPGSPATVTLANGFGGSGDWLALAAVGSRRHELPEVDLHRRGRRPTRRGRSPCRPPRARTSSASS